jgi:hypothetical protein
MTLIQTIFDVATPTNIKAAVASVGTLGVGGVGGVVASWWKRRDALQVHIDWNSVETQYGTDWAPVIYFQNVMDRALNVTGLRIYDSHRRVTEAYPFLSDDPDYDPLPLLIPAHERKRLFLDGNILKIVAERSGWITRHAHLSRVYIGVRTMGGKRKLYSAERGLHIDYRWPRFN